MRGVPPRRGLRREGGILGNDVERPGAVEVRPRNSRCSEDVLGSGRQHGRKITPHIAATSELLVKSPGVTQEDRTRRVSLG